MAKTSFIATGDVFITRRVPEEGYEGFHALQNCISSHDVAFTNLEMTFLRDEGIPNAVSGGTWASTDPVMLDDMKRYGFNLFNTANNHSCDYSHSGVLATIRHLKERNMVFSGTGATLGEASKPCAATKPWLTGSSRCAPPLMCRLRPPIPAAEARIFPT